LLCHANLHLDGVPSDLASDLAQLLVPALISKRLCSTHLFLISCFEHWLSRFLLWDRSAMLVPLAIEAVQPCNW